jgi:hypothetical protein
MSGGLNIGAQLAQEGSEGDINLLSAGLGALQGAMTTPGAADKFQAMKFGQVPGVTEGAGLTADFVPAVTGSTTTIPKDIGMFQKAANYGLEGLAKGSEFIEKMQGSDKFVDKLKLYTAPATQATGDLMYAQGQRDLKDLATDVVDEMGGGYTDDAYRAAIRKSMTAYGATEEEILAAIEAAGYRSGGRVALEFGGIPEAIDNVKRNEMEEYYKKFATDRYLSEMLESGSGLFNRGEDFFNRYEDMVKEGKLDSRMFDMLKEYKNLEKEAETTEDKFQNIDLIDKAEETLDKDALKYYDKKFKDLEKQEDDLTKQEEDIMALEKKTNFDASEITKTPDFQNWLRLYETDKMKALDHPYADIYLGVLGVKLKGRDKSYDEVVGFAEGGMPSVLPKGIEADYRGGGFIPIGSRERADDVPARLSENEFVMTADAVRAAGGGSVNRGAKRMYDLMHNLEARA